MLGTLAIALACACVVLVAEQGRVVMESGVRMRANENAFFDMLAAKDKSKGVPQKAEFHRRFTGRQERAAADKYFASLANRPVFARLSATSQKCMLWACRGTNSLCTLAGADVCGSAQISDDPRVLRPHPRTMVLS